MQYLYKLVLRDQAKVKEHRLGDHRMPHSWKLVAKMNYLRVTKTNRVTLGVKPEDTAWEKNQRLDPSQKGEKSVVVDTCSARFIRGVPLDANPRKPNCCGERRCLPWHDRFAWKPAVYTRSHGDRAGNHQLLCAFEGTEIRRYGEIRGQATSSMSFWSIKRWLGSGQK